MPSTQQLHRGRLQWGMFYAKWNPRLQLHLVLSLWSMVLDSQCAHEWMIWSWYSDHNFIYLPTAGKPGQSNKKLEEDQAVFRYIWSVCSQPVHMDHAPKWVTLANLTLWAWINNTHLDNTPNVLGPCKTFSAFWLYGHHLWSIHYPCVNSYLEKKHCENNLPALQIGLPPCQKHLACYLLHMPKMTFLSFSASSSTRGRSQTRGELSPWGFFLGISRVFSLEARNGESAEEWIRHGFSPLELAASWESFAGSSRVGRVM